MRRVLIYVDQHQQNDLSLSALSNVAAFSKHHFHRQFTALFGITVHRYVQLVRMKRASYRLAFGDGESVIKVALVLATRLPRRVRQNLSAVFPGNCRPGLRDRS